MSGVNLSTGPVAYVNLHQEMAVFDALPATLRAFLRDSPTKYLAVHVGQQIVAGARPGAVLARLQEQDRLNRAAEMRTLGY